MTRIPSLCVMFVGCWIAAAAAAAKDLPPLGKRVYILNENKKFSPGVIRGKAPVRATTVLRDPLQKKAADNVVPHRAPVVVRKPRPASDTSRLKLHPYDIAGKMTRPRVEFDREQLPVQPVEEPLEYNYLEKVLDAVSRDALIR